MAFCRKCGAPLDEGATRCPVCDFDVSGEEPVPSDDLPALDEEPAPSDDQPAPASAPAPASPSRAPRPMVLIVAIVVMVAVAAVALFMFMSSRCAAEGCMEEAAYGHYCISHVCLEGSCESQRGRSGPYCYYHQSQRDKAEAEAAANPARDLSISNVSISSSSSYVNASGTVTNRGNRTYTFIKVKGSFKNRSGEVVDTDWTYACGSEGLAPGETTSFQMSVPKKGNITTCSATILDCD